MAVLKFLGSEWQDIKEIFVNLQLDCLWAIQTFWKNKKRYAHLKVGNVGNSRLFRRVCIVVLTLTAWAAITISLKKGSSYNLRLRTWHCSSTLYG